METETLINSLEDKVSWLLTNTDQPKRTGTKLFTQIDAKKYSSGKIQIEKVTLKFKHSEERKVKRCEECDKIIFCKHHNTCYEHTPNSHFWDCILHTDEVQTTVKCKVN